MLRWSTLPIPLYGHWAVLSMAGQGAVVVTITNTVLSNYMLKVQSLPRLAPRFLLAPQEARVQVSVPRSLHRRRYHPVRQCQLVLALRRRPALALHVRPVPVQVLVFRLQARLAVRSARALHYRPPRVSVLQPRLLRRQVLVCRRQPQPVRRLR